MTKTKQLRIAAVLGVVSVLACTSAFAQSKKFDFGKREYEASCAACHGMKARGDGPYKPYLTKSPPDLTTLARSNRDILPFQSIYELIDGRRTLEAHGSRDMPIWGTVYSVAAAADHMDVPYDSERYIRTRIIALIEYLDRLQVR